MSTGFDSVSRVQCIRDFNSSGKKKGSHASLWMSFLSASLRRRTLAHNLVKPSTNYFQNAWVTTGKSCFHTNPVCRQYGLGPVPNRALSSRAAVRVDKHNATFTQIAQTNRQHQSITLSSSSPLHNIQRSYCTFESMAPTATSAPPKVSADEHRLPLDVKPLHYDITVRTDLEKLVFDGSVSVQCVVVIDPLNQTGVLIAILLLRLEVLKETSTIVFHTSQQKLNDISIHSDALGSSLAPTNQTFDPVSERAVLQFSSALPAGSKVVLNAKFEAELTGSMMGYYYSTSEEEKKKSYYALTQFEVRDCLPSTRILPQLPTLLTSLQLQGVLSRAGTSLCSRLPTASL